MNRDDWSESPIRDLVEIKTGPFGSMLHQHDYVVSGTPIVNPSHIRNGRIVPGELETVDSETRERLSEYSLKTGDIVMGRRGEMGRCALVHPVQDGWLCGSGSFILRRRAEVSMSFLQRLISQPKSISYLEQASIGSTMNNLNHDVLGSMRVVLPSLVEQEVIAEALSDADALVESLDALIAKKRDMKQAAMQQLLSGAVRLGGRTSPWCTRSVSALATITKGVQLGRADMNSMGAVPVWNGGIEPSGFTSAANVWRPVVTVSEGGNSCGWVGRPKGDFWLGGHCYALDPQDSCQSVGFLYHVLKSVEAKIMGLRVGSGLPNIQKTSLAEFSVRVPSEQTEASELTLLFDDLDAEIDALVARREKADLMKQGMMQELLSGRVRLV